jgi:hypothetical protein
LYNGDNATYLLVISGKETFLQKIDKKVFDSLSDRYTSYLSRPEVLNRDFNSFLNVSNQLYRLLFGNISLPAGRIIISPGGKYFPFESLVINKQPISYFLENYAVSYTYSARYLLHNFEANVVLASRDFVGFAPVNYSNGMAALSGSDQSLQRMHNYFSDAKSMVGKEASKNNFLSDYYRYQIIQLFTHATDSGSSGEPEIYFSDATLHMSDLLYEYRPATRLIVLSACETGEGKVYNGEGVFSFNRGFAALGIPSAVSNLWQIDNKSTYKITELFYKYVSKGLPLDVALQKAKIEFIKSSDNKLPYFWAASILVGQSNAIPLQKGFPWKWLTASVIVLLILGFWVWRIRQMYSTQFGIKRKLLHP